MRSNLLKIAFISLLLLGAVANGQEPAKAVLVDEFGELCSDDVRTRIDAFFVSISNEPNSIGYVVGLAKASMPGRYQKFFRLIRNHINFRNFYSDRVKFLRSADDENMRLQFWLVPQRASFVNAVPAYIRSPIVAPTLFDAGAIDSIEDGKVLFGEGGEPCDFGLDLEHFAKELSQQANVDAHLVATSDRAHSARFVRRALRLTRQALTKGYGAVSTRIKIIYAGRVKQSEMQLWLVPKGTKRPRGFTTHVPN